MRDEPMDRAVKDRAVKDRVNLPRASSMVFTLLALLSCRFFEYSPYQIPLRDGGDAHLEQALLRIGRTDGPEGDFSFAVIADIQSDYDELRAAVRTINADTSIRFVFVDGDLTQYGLLREFEWVRDRLDRLNVPYLPVIGNHDALANGLDIFRRMFGPLDYAFDYRGTRFVVFNDNAWEFSHGAPDTTWLRTALEAPDGVRLIPVAHIPPWGDQIPASLDSALTALFARRGATLCVYGHQHHYHFMLHDGKRSPYVIADNIGDRNFVKVTLIGDSDFTVERRFF